VFTYVGLIQTYKELPHGGAKLFCQKSPCITQLTLERNLVHIWSRATPPKSPNETRVAHRVEGKIQITAKTVPRFEDYPRLRTLNKPKQPSTSKDFHYLFLYSALRHLFTIPEELYIRTAPNLPGPLYKNSFLGPEGPVK